MFVFVCVCGPVLCVIRGQHEGLWGVFLDRDQKSSSKGHYVLWALNSSIPLLHYHRANNHRAKTCTVRPLSNTWTPHPHLTPPPLIECSQLRAYMTLSKKAHNHPSCSSFITFLSLFTWTALSALHIFSFDDMLVNILTLFFNAICLSHIFLKMFLCMCSRLLHSNLYMSKFRFLEE